LTAHDLLLTFDFPPIGGGISRWMSEIARRYPPGTLTVSTGRMPGDTLGDTAFPNAIDRLDLPSRRLRTLIGQVRWANRAMALNHKTPFRFAWCDNIRPSAYPASILKQFRGVPYGVIVHGSDLFDIRANFRRSRVKRMVTRQLLGRAATIVANSRWTQRLLTEVLDELGLPDAMDRSRVVSLGTDPGRFHPDVDTSSFRREYGIPDGRWIVTVARLEAFKGVDTTIRALRLLAADHPDVRYAVVGDGSFRSGAEALARTEGVADRVHFLSRVPDDVLPAAYATATIYSGLTRETARDVEGFGISLVEAQATGKPVVAGRTGGIVDAVADGETGILVDPTDAQAAAAAFKSLLDEPARGDAMGRAGRKAVERHFNWDRVIADLRGIAAQLGRQVATASQPEPLRA
jgi:phosphatidylinositol alpha-1,6-mannosyltransferase